MFLTIGFIFLLACVGRCVEVDIVVMPILSIKATKPSSNTRLGFTCRKAKDGTSLLFIITSVDPLGLFGGTDLRCGQQLLRINGISLNDVDVDGIKAILSSLPAGDVSLIVRGTVSPSDGAIFTFTLSGQSINAKMKTEYEIPKILKDASPCQVSYPYFNRK